MSVDAQQLIEETDAPADEPIEELDVRNLGPPKPLSETLERLAEMDGGVLVQRNDRAPQHLYPKLDDRGYSYETQETDDAVVTLIWEN
jgi:TusA-related sulfurtransferase